MSQITSHMVSGFYSCSKLHSYDQQDRALQSRFNPLTTSRKHSLSLLSKPNFWRCWGQMPVYRGNYMKHRDTACRLTADTIKLYKILLVITVYFNSIKNSEFYSGHSVGTFTWCTSQSLILYFYPTLQTFGVRSPWWLQH